MVLAEVAVAAGQRDVLRVRRDALLAEVVVFGAAAFEAGPGDDEAVVLLDGFAGDEFLDGGEDLYDAREERAPVHVIEAGRELERAGEVLHDFDVGGGNQLGQQLEVGEDEVAELVGLLLVEGVALDGGHHRAEDFRPEDVGEGV